MKHLSLKKVSLMFLALAQGLCSRAAYADDAPDTSSPPARIQTLQRSVKIARIPPITISHGAPTSMANPASVPMAQNDKSDPSFLQNVLSLSRKWGDGYAPGISIDGGIPPLELTWSLNLNMLPGNLGFIKNGNDGQDNFYIDYDRKDIDPPMPRVKANISLLGMQWSFETPVGIRKSDSTREKDSSSGARFSWIGDGTSVIAEIDGFPDDFNFNRGRKRHALGITREWDLDKVMPGLSLYVSQVALGNPHKMSSLTQGGLKYSAAGLSLTAAGGAQAPLNGFSPMERRVQGGFFITMACNF
ncbi:MAG: hypothetical protein SFW62_02350 [Alphaproteobacteria bacterium]|nr:hypothetical protein [Alphaproteobacteria bacterium]